MVKRTNGFARGFTIKQNMVFAQQNERFKSVHFFGHGKTKAYWKA
jgi:hypothetical protein